MQPLRPGTHGLPAVLTSEQQKLLDEYNMLLSQRFFTEPGKEDPLVVEAREKRLAVLFKLLGLK
jgi:hypothetical protein